MAERACCPSTVRCRRAEYDPLNDIMPIEDDRLFYLTGAGITVMYRPYEITTGLDPWPELSIPLST